MGMGDEMNNILEGRTLTGMKIADDKKAILFESVEGNIIAKADGDCCSSTWIEHIELPAMGFPAMVMTIEDLNMPDVEQKDDYEVVQAYGCKISTDKGDIVIEYRNESNGYYGGNLAWPGDYFYGGVYGQNISEEKWTDIIE